MPKSMTVSCEYQLRSFNGHKLNYGWYRGYKEYST
jgi:hypothetical protein